MSTPKTPLLTQKARDLEYAAFRDWIVAATNNPTMRTLPSTAKAQRARPKAPDAVIRHTRADALLASFTRNVYSQEGRCMGCHRAGTPANNENVKKYGTRVAWFAPDNPEETMRRVISQNLVNVNAPEQSLLLLKPLNKVPHGGGGKFLYGDGGYKLFRAWIEDYAKSVQGAYLSVKNLPPPPTESLYFSESILNVKNAPVAWANHLIRVDAYVWERQRNTWSKRPVATGDRQLGANGETNVLMFLVVPVGSAEEQSARKNAQLTQGRYLLKYYVDLNGKIERDYKTPTDSPELYRGQQELTTAWARGWGGMTQISVNLQ